MMSKNNDIGISIIIPVYNREKYLKQAIDSVIAQNYQGELEILISDDGSTDSSLDIARSYNDARIFILEKDKKDKSQGAAASRNRALNIASKPFICFLDSDDYQKGDFLNSMTNILLKNEKIGYVFCRTEELIEDDNENKIIPWTKKRVLKLDTRYLGLTGSKVINTNCFLFRKEVFEKVGVFNENYTNAEDADLWIRIGEQFRGEFLDYTGVVRRTHNSGQLTNNNNSIKNACTVTVAEEAIKRNSTNSKDKYRMYRLKNIILSNQGSLTKTELVLKRAFIIIRYPISFIKHLYLISSYKI